uniref:GRIP and coiled-coil domain containing 1 n=1 Tax=Pseudonaja textilis TaxID=8673 RepID=A0A670ZUY5_PSETE
MSELLGAYEKARQKDQAALQKLKDRLLQLDLENKTLAVAASGHATVGLALEDGRLDANVLRDQVEKLTELALVAAEHAPPLVGDGEAVCPAEPAKDAESGDGEKATLACYQQELKQLKEEFERYKARAQVVLKNKSAKDGNLARELEESQEQLLELKEKYVSLRLSCEEEAKQHQEQLEAKRREAALLQQLHRQELERCLSEGREKALRLEEEMHKQRDRALAVLMEKDQELQQLRALSVPFGVQAPKTATGPGSGLRFPPPDLGAPFLAPSPSQGPRFTPLPSVNMASHLTRATLGGPTGVGETGQGTFLTPFTAQKRAAGVCGLSSLQSPRAVSVCLLGLKRTSVSHVKGWSATGHLAAVFGMGTWRHLSLLEIRPFRVLALRFTYRFSVLHSPP